MNSRRFLIAIASLGVLHNLLRVIALMLGARWGFLNYLPFAGYRTPRLPEVLGIAGVLAVLAAAAWAARSLWRKSEEPSPVFSSAIWAIGAAIAIGVLAVYASTIGARTYGWTLFVVTPFLMGFISSLALAHQKPITLGDAFWVSLLSVILLGGLLLLLAIEGAVCLVMALPIAVPLAITGGAAGYLSQRRLAARSPMMFLVLLGIAPFGPTLERALQPPAELFTVTTSIDISAAPERVWRAVLQPAKLAPPSQVLFRAGIAYPLASHIEGSGLAATRYCDFSTGKLVEPVLIWKEGSRLRFTVVSNPLPMQEWTPYARIHPPHLEGFLASRQGEFRLEPLPNGGTRLFATTWYQHHMWPAAYWRAWSDYIIHRVHDMVLENVRQRAVMPTLPAPGPS